MRVLTHTCNLLFVVGMVISPIARAATLSGSSTVANPGDQEVSVSLVLEHDVDYAGMEFLLSYDPTYLTLDTVIASPSLVDQTGSGFNEFAPGSVAFLVFSFEGADLLSDSADVFQVFFDVSIDAPPAQYPITLSEVAAVKSNLDYDSTVASSGSITVGCPIVDGCPNQGDVAPVMTGGDGTINLLDIVAIIDFVFRDGPELPRSATCPTSRAEWACDGVIDLLDIVTAVNFVFRGGSAACNPCACSPYPWNCP